MTDPKDLTALHELLQAPGDLDLTAAARLFTTIFEADGSLLFVVDAMGKELQVGAADPPGGVVERALRIPIGYGVAGLVALNGQAVSLVADSPRNSAHRGAARARSRPDSLPDVLPGSWDRLDHRGRGVGASESAAPVHRG